MRSTLLISFLAICWVNGAIRPRLKRESETGHPDFGLYKLTLALKPTLFSIMIFIRCLILVQAMQFI